MAASFVANIDCNFHGEGPALIVFIYIKVEGRLRKIRVRRIEKIRTVGCVGFRVVLRYGIQAIVPENDTVERRRLEDFHFNVEKKVSEIPDGQVRKTIGKRDTAETGKRILILVFVIIDGVNSFLCPA